MRVQLVGIITVALIVLVWSFFFVTRDVRGDSRPAIVVLNRADGLREGASVTYLGLMVGTVERLTIHEGKVVADLRIGRTDVELRRGDTVRLRTLGILGDKVFDIVPGPRTAPVLAPGDTLVAARQPDAPPEEIVEKLLRELKIDTGGSRPPPS